MKNFEDLLQQQLSSQQKGANVRKVIAELQTGDYGDPFPVLATYLNHPNEQVQTRVARIMMELNSERASEYMLALLDHEDWRFEICYLVARYGGAVELVEPIGKLLSTSDDADTRYMAVVALKVMGDKRSIPMLVNVIQSDKGFDHDGNSISDMAREAILYIERKK